MKKLFTAFLLAASFCVLAQADKPSPDAAQKNLARVKEAMKGAKSESGFVFYSVPAMSNVMRLAHQYPFDGRLNTEVRASLAKDEYENASFQIYPFEDMSLEFKVNPLAAKDGKTLPASALDLKVVKIWLQNGNGWYSYFADPGLAPCPELLLKDENLIKSDFENKANYARVKQNGKDVYKWISPNRQMDSSYTEHGWLTFSSFRAMREDFSDAETLQAVSFKKGEFKQMFLTVHASAGQPEGIYRGSIDVLRNGKKISAIPVAVRVLPFALPYPKAPDLKRNFLVTLYSGPSIRRFMGYNGGDRALAVQQMRAVMKNYKAHNLLNPLLENNSSEKSDIIEYFGFLKEAGLPTDHIMGGIMRFVYEKGPDGKLTANHMRMAEEDAEKWKEIMLEGLGHTNITLISSDEPPASWVEFMRDAWRFYNERGIGMFTAGSEGIFRKGGYIYDAMPLAFAPEDAKAVRMPVAVGAGQTGFYAIQHNGVENPDYVRRQHGLLGYSSGHSMIINYEFGWGTWNDLAYDLYKPMMLAYMTRTGLVDTLAWEGFREAVDDIRYTTLFRTEAERCRDSKNLDTRYAGRQALMWWGDIDFEVADLNAVRADMIEYILKLRNLK